MSGGGEPRPGAEPVMELTEIVREAIAALEDRKGEEIVILDMHAVSSFTDTMVLCTGRSEPHTQALADAVEERLREAGHKPSHVEGKREGHWILLDYLSLVIHVFTPDMRQFYQLEKLWRDAPMMEWRGGSGREETAADA